MFHAHDGWFFERMEDGSVRIIKRTEAEEDSPIIAEGIFEANEKANHWASIVASMSKGDEVDGRFYAAKRFHESEGAVEIISKSLLAQIEDYLEQQARP